ncbi:STAS domain-containing protein [Pseudonocardia spinosispora]|uniref:STAS domain-containing protein n=1 Tax=Pseudonocardia spinosispora TaxID=103441 RepID=UPI0012EBAB78
MVSELACDLAAPWLLIDYSDEDVAVVIASGDISGFRSEELWSALEEALQQANGRLVVADLTGVTSFDDSSLDALAEVASASARRHLDLCALIRPLSALHEHARVRGLSELLPIHPSMSALLPATGKVRDDQAPVVGAERWSSSRSTDRQGPRSPRSVRRRPPPAGRPERAGSARRG